jgi:ADP-dependent NAD(P)H-hydrate dehydratase / NAD(P)H-hydrate epimerase
MQQVYHSREIQAWEQRWFAAGNASYGLMQQVAWSIAQQLQALFIEKKLQHIAVCCGGGNNAGDGYLIAKYLHNIGFDVCVYASERGASHDLNLAYQDALDSKVNITQGFDFTQAYDVYIDALFGIGLNRELNVEWQAVIAHMNAQSGLKIAVDLPSGLNANTGQPLPCAVVADHTFTVLGLKAGLFTGKGKAFSGVVHTVALLPFDSKLRALAQLSPLQIHLPQREAFGHKGSYGHVLVVGGHSDMGGAVIMAAEAAFCAGAGKVTVACDAKHHTAILARSPNIMLRDINALNAADIQNLVCQVDAVCFGMGLGRDAWAAEKFQQWFELINQDDLTLVLDADGLWFLAEQATTLSQHTYLTPHPGEAAKLLDCRVVDVEADRIAAIYALQQKYGAKWVLKGAGSLILEQQLWICNAGNAGMGTGGMGDVLAGMIASLKAQFGAQIQLHQIVTLHAKAGDYLALQGQRGLQAQHMNQAVYHIVNGE